MDPAVPAVWKTSRGLESFGIENVEGIMTHFSFEKTAYYSLMIFWARKNKSFRNTFSFGKVMYYSLTILGARKIAAVLTPFPLEK